MKEIVIVLGASTKVGRYSNKAVKALLQHKHTVIPIGREVGSNIDGQTIIGSFEALMEGTKIDTISIYLNQHNQLGYQDQIIRLKPKRVIFNPGAENAEFYSNLNGNGIEAINACTLVMLSIGTF